MSYRPGKKNFHIAAKVGRAMRPRSPLIYNGEKYIFKCQCGFDSKISRDMLDLIKSGVEAHKLCSRCHKKHMIYAPDGLDLNKPITNKNGKFQFSDEQIAEILEKRYNRDEIMEIYGVSTSTAYRILNKYK